MENNKRIDSSKIQWVQDACTSIIYLLEQIRKEQFNTDLQNCCNNCGNFEPTFVRNGLCIDGTTIYENYISCKHREICKHISSYNENEPKERFADEI